LSKEVIENDSGNSDYWWLLVDNCKKHLGGMYNSHDLSSNYSNMLIFVTKITDFFTIEISDYC